MLSSQFWISSSLFNMAVKQFLSIVSFSIFNMQRELQYTTILEKMLFLCECHTIFLKRRLRLILLQAILLMSLHNTISLMQMSTSNVLILPEMCCKVCALPQDNVKAMSLIYGDPGLNFCMINKTVAISSRNVAGLVCRNWVVTIQQIFWPIWHNCTSNSL